MSKRLLVLGGTQISCEIIRTAKEMGIYTIVADYNDVSKSPGKQIADEHYLVDITDVNAVVALFKGKHIDGVLVGFSDMLLPFYSEICEGLSLPAYGTREQFVMFSHKEKYKELLRKYEIPTIEEYQINGVEDIDNESIIYPVIVKPSNGSGARGIKICDNSTSLKNAYLESSTNTKLIVERYIDEKEVTVFWLFLNGDYYLTGIGNRHVKHNQEGVIPLPTGYTYPSNLTENYIATIEPKVKKMLKSVDVKNGMMFMQCKVVDNTCYVYDIGYRLTGSLEYKNFEATCGFNPMKMMINFAITGNMEADHERDRINPYFGKYTFNISYLIKPGTIKEYEGLQDLREQEGFIDYVVEHYPGEIITEKMRGLLAQISLRVFGVADTRKELWERISEMQKIVKIFSDAGENMVLSGMEADDMEDVCQLDE